MIQSSLGNFWKALITGAVAFLATYGTQLIGLIPHSISNATVGGILTLIVAWIVHSQATPAGSTIQKP